MDARKSIEEAVEAWKNTSTWKQENEEYMAEYGDALFVGGWHKCVEHVTALYLNIGLMSIIEP